MARQPFLPTYTGTPVSIASFSIEELPKLAELVGRITVNWSGVDLQMSLLLGSLLGVENEAAVAVFLSLRNHRAQRDALTAAAEKCLDGELKEGFDALVAIHRRLDKQRNDVVHGVWGKGQATPDGIVWSSMQDHANMLIRDYHNFTPGNESPEYDRAHAITKDLFAVKYSDLEALNEDVIVFAQSIGHFHGHLRYQNHVAGDNALKSFRENRLVAEELAR